MSFREQGVDKVSISHLLTAHPRASLAREIHNPALRWPKGPKGPDRVVGGPFTPYSAHQALWALTLWALMGPPRVPMVS